MNHYPVKPPRYLVCVDRRSESQAALRLASAKASVRGGRISLIHVIEPADFQTLPGVAARMEAEQRIEAESLVQQMASEIYVKSGVTPCLAIREGQIGEEILSYASEEKDATMLVLGVAEHSASRGKLTGWLATQLGARLLIPLLLVPGNLTDQQLEALI